MPFINGEQTINGKLGEIWMNLDGEIRLAMEVKKIEAKIRQLFKTNAAFAKSIVL